MTSAPASRERLIKWDDPTPLAQVFALEGGLAMLRGILAGQLPPAPMAVLLDLRLESVQEGQTALSAAPGEEHVNEVGLVHGGLASAMLDNAMGTTLASTLGPGDRAAGLNLNVSFLRPLRPGMGRVRAEAHIVRLGRRVAHLEANLTHEATDELLARATGAFSVARAEPEAR